MEDDPYRRLRFEGAFIPPIKYFDHLMRTPQTFECVKLEKKRGNIVLSRRAVIEKNRNKELSELWYKNSANYVTEFYGQLSFEKISKKKSLVTNEELYGNNILTKDDIAFTKTDLYKASELILANGTRKNAKKFITHLINTSSTPGQLQIIAKLSKDLGRLDLSIKASKFAKKKGFNLYHYAYPSIKSSSINSR